MNKTPIKLLFVEDSEIDVELALRAIKKDGFDISWERVESEEDMRKALDTSPPQAILSDFSMPRFNGAQALMLARQRAPDIPFIFLSGTIGEERAIEAIRMGATDYVLKGNAQRLGTAVRRALTEAADRERVRIVEEERERLTEILEATSDFVAMTTPEGEIIHLNAAGRRMIGVGEFGKIGKMMNEVLPLWANELMEREGWPGAEKDGIWQGETAILSANNKEIPVSQVVIAHRGMDDRIRFFSTIARDISERKAYEARIEHFANYDALTGLPNRNLLRDRAVQVMAHARRNGGMAALLAINMNRFKLVNESYSHSAGDELLCLMASRLRGIAREGDTVARLTSDSFAILATDLRPDEIVGLVRKVHEILRPAFILEGKQELHVTVSIGASVYPRDGDSFDVLYRNAEAAMHRAKSDEQGGFQFYAEAMTRGAVARIEIENELRLALDRGELEMVFQPQTLLATGQMIGVEALMRWNHAERGPISPASFIPIAEEAGLIHALGEFALVRACRQIKAWGDAGVAALRVAVNVSAHQFHSQGFIELVNRVLREEGVSPHCIELELTESVLVEDQNNAVTILKRLKALGVQVAIDDFGTGYSSLSYLSRLPIDCLKIDQSFVMRITERGRDSAIVLAIISLAHSLGLRVIAEGIEMVEQRDFLHLHQCEEGQGYYFSRPLAADQVAQAVTQGMGTMKPGIAPKRD